MKKINRSLQSTEIFINYHLTMIKKRSEEVDKLLIEHDAIRLKLGLPPNPEIEELREENETWKKIIKGEVEI